MLRPYRRVGPRRSYNRSTRLSSPMPSGPAFLFDLDGTLVDSVYQHVLAWREALESAGIELSVWRIHRRIGMSGGLFLNALLRETGRTMTAEDTARVQRVHAEAFARQGGQGRPPPAAPARSPWACCRAATDRKSWSGPAPIASTRTPRTCCGTWTKSVFAEQRTATRTELQTRRLRPASNRHDPGRRRLRPPHAA